MKISLIENGTSIEVQAPYNPLFPDHSESIGGKWDNDKKVWTFHKTKEPYVLDLLNSFYDPDILDLKTVALIINVSDEAIQINKMFPRILFYIMDISESQNGSQQSLYYEVKSGNISRYGTCHTPVFETEPGTTIVLTNIPLDLALHMKRVALDYVSLVDVSTDSMFSSGALETEYEDICRHLAALADGERCGGSTAYNEETKRCQERLIQIQSALDKNVLQFGGPDGRTPEPVKA